MIDSSKNVIIGFQSFQKSLQLHYCCLFLKQGTSTCMEKIITVKQEPIDDAYPTPPSTATASTTTTTVTATTTVAQNVTTKPTNVVTLGTATVTSTAAAAAAASEPQIFFIQPKPELQKTQCTVVSVLQGLYQITYKLSIVY